MDKKKALKRLLIIIASELVAVALFVGLLDPFYQYHSPYFNLEPVLYDRDNQVPGSLRTLDYDSVLLGSSVAENFDSSFLDDIYQCETLKIIRASGSTADLLYYLEQIHEKKELKQVFWCMDIFALTASTEVTLYGGDTPRYLHTKNVLDDIPYIYNKEIIMMKIPMMLAYSYLGTYSEGHAYDWSADKEFGAAKAMQAYVKPGQPIENLDFTEEIPDIERNIQMAVEEIQAHPEISYTVMFPPYSMMWWDCGYVNGLGEKYFYVLEKALPALVECENASVYFFQSDEEIICNLDNYMDMIHYSPQINQYMLDCIAEDAMTGDSRDNTEDTSESNPKDSEKGSHRVTEENLETVLAKMRETYEYIINEGIYTYYAK